MCLAFSQFLGCPQSYCYSFDVYDILALYDNDKLEGFIIFRESYFYKITASKLPMPTPSLSNVGYFSVNEPFEQALENIDAAINYAEEKYQYYMLIKDNIVKFYRNNKLTEADSDNPSVVFKGLPSGVKLDCGFYDSKASVLYLFYGRKYKAFKRDANRGLNFWSNSSSEKFINEVSGLPDYLDAGIGSQGSDQSDQNYLIKGQYFYEVTSGQELNSKIYEPVPSVATSEAGKGIFYINSEACPESGQYNIRARLENYLPKLKPIVDNEYENELSRKSDGNNHQLLITIIATVIVTVIALLIGAFLFLDPRGKRRKKKASSRT